MKTYTAREWLEKTLPEGGEWQKILDRVFWHEHPDHEGVSFEPATGRICGYCVKITGNNFVWKDGLTIRITRAEAIDQLMVSAIEAGEVSSTPDPYAHLPHGGWWVHDNDGLTFWPSECDYGCKYNFGGAYLHTYSVRWKDRPEWAKKEIRLTRDQAIAIIEAHKASKEPTTDAVEILKRRRGENPERQANVDKATARAKAEEASKEPTPAPSFGGPHDEQAVKWAKERGREVLAYAYMWDGVKEYIGLSHMGPEDWDEIMTGYPPGGYRYILAPLAQPEPEPGEDDIDELIASLKPMPPKSVRKLGTIIPDGAIDPQLFELVKAVLPARAAMDSYDGMKWAEGIASDTMQIAKAMLAELRKEGEK